MSAPFCLCCRRRSATPDPTRASVFMRFETTEEETGSLLVGVGFGSLADEAPEAVADAASAVETSAQERRRTEEERSPRVRFCDECRADALSRAPSDDERLALLLSAVHGLDAVEILLGEVGRARRRLERRGRKLPVPGADRILKMADKRREAERLIETPAQKARRPGESAGALRARRHRARKRLRSK